MEQCTDSNLMKPTVYISKRAYATIKAELEEFPNKETGGVFIGYHKNNEWYIVESTFSGPYAIHKSASFENDYDYTKYEIRKIKNLYTSDLSIIGFWHSHINPSDFSYADDETNANFSALNKFGSISAIYDVTTNHFRFFEVTLPLSYSEVGYQIYNKSEHSYRKE